MRYGCCLSMVASKEDPLGLRYLEEAAHLGFDYVELPLTGLAGLSEEEFTALQERLKAAGIGCEACNNFFPGEMHLIGPDRDEEQILKYTELVLGRAAELGAEFAGLGSGPARSVPKGVTLEEGYEQLKGLLRKQDEIAAAKGITILIEPLRSKESNLIHTVWEGRRLAEEVNREHVKFLVDYYHLCEEKEPVDHVACQDPKELCHVHFARPQDRYYPVKEEEKDYQEFFQALKSIGYDKRVSFEAYARNFPEEAREALCLLKEQLGE